MRVRFWGLCLLACVAPIRGAWGGGLEPSAPSQLLEIRTFGTPCSAAGSIALDLRTLKDGSTIIGYALPAKQVAVIRSVRFDAATTAATSVTVFLETAGNFLSYVEGISDAAGRFEGTFTFDPGVAVSNLANFCVRTQTGGSIAATANGFLAKDR